MDIRDIIKTKYPIIQGGMANIATGEFAAAISNAGGLGLIAAGGMKPEQLRENIDRARELTDKPFGAGPEPRLPPPAPAIQASMFRLSRRWASR